MKRIPTLLIAVMIAYALSDLWAGVTPPPPSTPGALEVVLNDRRVEMPLRHTDVRVEISAFVARTVVEQVFVNPFHRPVHAVYVFPLGDRAAVDDFELRSGDRVIRGEIHRRAEAREIFETAERRGYQAALLEQERPNVFAQYVANLMPGHEVRVRLRTVELLQYEEGVYQYVFPMVVGERYVPGEMLDRVPTADDTGADPLDAEEDEGTDEPETGDEDGDPIEGGPEVEGAKVVAEAGAGTEPTSSHPDRLNPRRLPQGVRSGHDIDVHVELSAGVPIREVLSPNQSVYVHQTDAKSALVDLGDESRIPNKDFVLRWQVSSETPAVGLLAHRQERDGFFTLLVQPKGRIEPVEAAPKEIVFVLDTSGSMSGAPIEMSKAFMREALGTLGPRDRFNLIRFASGSSMFSPESLPNTPGEVERALTWMEGLEADGGAEMLRGLARALEGKVESGTYRQIVFLTDGCIGNDDAVLARMSELSRQFRVFTLGIGSGVNHYLLRRMAEVGGGAYTFIPDDADRWTALSRFQAWITRPYLTDIEVDWGGLPIHDLVPRRGRDLFSGQSLYLVGRYDAAASGTVILRGYLGRSYWEQRIEVALPEVEPSHGALGSIWARHRMDELLLEHTAEVSEAVREQVTELALAHRLMSPYTSFVAVDWSSAVNPGGDADRVEQAVPSPEGVGIEGGVGEIVRVEAKRPVVDLEKTSASTQFSDEFLQDLPMKRRFYHNMLTFAPGVQDSDGDGNPNVHGARDRDFKTVVSGVSNLDPLMGQALTNVGMDSIEEIEIITTGAGVEYGRAQGGFANVIQRQGSNDFEGQAELLFRSHRLDRGGAGGGQYGARPDFGGYAAGLRLSGPFIKDRLWYRLAHSAFDRDDPVDTTANLEVAGSRSVTHDASLTWQVSPRNKLSVDLSSDMGVQENLGVGSWTGPDATLAVEHRGPRYQWIWTSPFSPRLLFETILGYQDQRFELRANTEGAPGGCMAEAGSPFAGAYCSDWIAHRNRGSFYRQIEDQRERLSLKSTAILYAGRVAGASHQLRMGVGIDDERYARRLTREPSLIRTTNGEAGEELVVARVASRRTSEVPSAAVYWAAWVEDQMKPRSNIVVTVGLRLDHAELHGTGLTEPNLDASSSGPDRRQENVVVADRQLSPFLSASWDPWSGGKSKLSFSVRRYHGELHPALALIDLEPLTTDVQLVPVPEPGQGASGPNVQTLDRQIKTPYQDEWTLAFEREIAMETRASLTWIARAYRDQLGHVDLNLVRGGPYGPRIDPRWGEVLLVGNFRSADYRALVLELVRRGYGDWEMQASYTWSRLFGDAEEFDPLAGDERSRVVERDGYQSTDRRHVIKLQATKLAAWGFRLGGVVRWESGLPYTALEPRLFRVGAPGGGSISVPRLDSASGRRNDLRNEATWTLDAKVTKTLPLGPRADLDVSLEAFNLLDDDTLQIRDDAWGSGLVIDGAADATRRFGRRYQIGLRLSF